MLTWIFRIGGGWWSWRAMGKRKEMFTSDSVITATLYLYWNYSYSYVSYLNSLYKHSSLYPSMAPLSAALSLSSPGSSEEQGIMSASLNLNQLRAIHFSNFSFIFSSNNYFLRETLLLYKFVTIFTFHFTTNTEKKGLVKLSLKGG